METQCPDCKVELTQIIIPAEQAWTEEQGTYIRDEETTGFYECGACGFDTTLDYEKASN